MHRAKIHTAVRHFAMKIGRKIVLKEKGNEMRGV